MVVKVMQCYEEHCTWGEILWVDRFSVSFIFLAHSLPGTLSHISLCAIVAVSFM